MTATLDAAEAAVRAGEMARARALYEAVEDRDGGSARLHYGLGFIALHAGEAETARDRLEACLRLDPEHAKAMAALGSALLAMGEPAAALARFEAARARAPGANAAMNVAVAALRAGAYDRALPALDALAQETRLGARERAEAFRLRAEALGGLNRLEDALAAVAKAQTLDPQALAIHRTAGTLLRRARRAEEALRHLMAAWDGGSRQRALALEIAATQQALRNGAGCREWLDRALGTERGVEGEREVAALWARAAGLHERENDLAAASAAADKALSLDPKDRVARLMMAVLARRGGEMDRARGLIDGLLVEAGAAESMGLQFEAARLAEATGRPADALEHAVRANALAARPPHVVRMRGDRAARLEAMEAALAAIERMSLVQRAPPPPAPSPPTRAPKGPRPVFLIGMPRSGTTLVGDRLGRHAAVTVAVETSAIERAVALVEKETGKRYPDCVMALSSELAARARETAREAWRQRLGTAYEAAASADGALLLDQHPFNAERLAMITALYPGAPILRLVRDPRDVALSCFLQDFRLTAATAPFVDLEEAAHMVARLEAMLSDLVACTGAHIETVVFEDLIADPVRAFADLQRALNLRPDPAILDEAADMGAARTASYAQVAGPITDRGVGRWRRYAGILPAGWTDILAETAERLGYPAG
ncbi:sulfotransferase [Marivibrio halodurans]|uniref:Sulfotransferase n=1 Tax=Marivibrio halodurans TaxID=2039722 RepID=A0A8J7V151_9PROT|nr:tetratricopeptide repeat-containing sulfotransferase family protein [Marivibrio halodurans]MBP5855945.1 sulfotransferase [Marivibrio halodurans]